MLLMLNILCWLFVLFSLVDIVRHKMRRKWLAILFSILYMGFSIQTGSISSITFQFHVGVVQCIQYAQTPAGMYFHLYPPVGAALYWLALRKRQLLPAALGPDESPAATQHISPEEAVRQPDEAEPPTIDEIPSEPTE